MVLIALTWMYNDLGGADENFAVRNILNASGILCFGSASTNLAAGQWTYSERAFPWFAIVWSVIFSTMQIMDLEDMKGDAARGRKTMPISLGQSLTRWSIIMSIISWSLICPVFWHLTISGFILSLSAGCFLAFRVCFYRGMREDKMNFHIWSLWTSVLYALPVFQHYKSMKVIG